MTDPVILGPDGQPLPADLRRRAQATAMSASWRRAYQGAGTDHAALREWRAPFVSGQAAVSADREPLSARVHDMARNDGWVFAAIDKKLVNLVGAGFRLNAMPNWRYLGLTRDQAQTIGEQIETLWRDYSEGGGFWADAERAGTAMSVVTSATWHYIADGEAFGILVWREDAPAGWRTAMQVVHPARCSNPRGTMDRVDLRDGVSLDALGAATGYWFADAHPGDWHLPGQMPQHWTFIERETEWGRPRVVHLRRRREAGMTRAVADLVPFMRKGRQLHQYDDYELSAAALNALLAAFVTTPLDAGALADALEAEQPAEALGGLMDAMMQAQASVYKESPIRMAGGQINFLNPGEDVELSRPQHPNSGFESFFKFGLRNLAAVLGITAEQLTMDWSEVNYSSARAALQEVWRGFQAMRAEIIAQFLQPWYRAWLEEVFDKGLLDLPAGAPSFALAPDAWAGAHWIGQARGYIDPQKEAEAAAMRISLNVSTLEREAAEQGLDWREVIEQRARERAAMAALGLDPDPGRPEARIQPQQPEGADETDGEELSGAEAKRRRQARARSRSGVPLIGRRAA